MTKVKLESKHKICLFQAISFAVDIQINLLLPLTVWPDYKLRGGKKQAKGKSHKVQTTEYSWDSMQA